MAMEITVCFLVMVVCGVSTAMTLDPDATDDVILNIFDKNTYMDYNRHALPPSDGPVSVRLHVNVRLIENLDVEKQILSVKMYLGQSWRDDRIPKFLESIGVNRSEFLYMSSSQIWIPDLRLYNSGVIPPAVIFIERKRALTHRCFKVHDESADLRQNDFDDIQVNVSPDGRIIFIPDTITHSYCMLDWDIEADDKVNCTLEFGYWTHNGNQITFSESSAIEVHDYLDLNREWKLTGHFLELKKNKYECCPETFVSELVTFELQRKPFIKH